MVYKALICDWDNTLALEFTCNLFPGAESLLTDVLAKGIILYIVTARPSQDDVKKDIFNSLTKRYGIAILENNIRWVGAKKYQGHDVAAELKAAEIKKIISELNIKANEVLFVDDKDAYVAAVKKNGIQALLVPEACMHYCNEVNQADFARNQFFQSIQKMLVLPNTLQKKNNKITLSTLKKPVNIMFALSMLFIIGGIVGLILTTATSSIAFILFVASLVFGAVLASACFVKKKTNPVFDVGQDPLKTLSQSSIAKALKNNVNNVKTNVARVSAQFTSNPERTSMTISTSKQALLANEGTTSDTDESSELPAPPPLSLIKAK